MKRLLFVISCLFLSATAFSQAVIQRSGPGNTVQDARLMAQYNFFAPRYQDTTAANFQRGIDSSGALIFTYDVSAYWFRSSNPKKWVQILPSGGGSGQRAWLDGGNSNLLGDGAGNAYFGSLTNLGIKFNTNSTTRFILDKAGVKPIDATATPIGIDANGYLAYVSGGGGGGLLPKFPLYSSGAYIYADTSKLDSSLVTWAQLRNKYDSSLHIGDTLFDVQSPLTFQFNVVTGRNLLYIDSTGNNNKVPIPDSATLSNPTGYLQGKATVGVWDSTVFVSSLPAGWTSFGISPSFSSGLVLSGNGGTICSGFAYKNTGYFASQNYTQSIEFTLNTIPTSPSSYLYAGKRSANTSQQTQNAIAVRRVNGTTWKIVPYILYGCGPTDVDSSEAIPMTAGQKYRTDISASTSNLYSKLTLLKANGEDSITAAVNYKYLPSASSFLQPANTGAEWIGAAGTTGNYTVTKSVTKMYDLKQVDVLFVGNSIGTRYDATSVKNHYSYMSMINSNKTWANASGGGDRLIEMNLRVNEIINMAPTYCIIEAGVNDVASDIRLGLTTLIDTLQAHNIIPIFLKLFSGASKDTVAYNVCREQGVKLVDANRPNQVLPTTDGLHPTDLGEQQITYILKSECPYVFGTTGGSELYTLRGLGDVYTSSLTNGQTYVYNSTTGRFENGLPVSGAAGNNHELQFNSSGSLGGVLNSYVDGATGNLGFNTVPLSKFHMNNAIFLSSIDNPSSGTGLQMGWYGAGGYSIIRAYDFSGGTAQNMAFGKSDQQLWLAATGNVNINGTTADAIFRVDGRPKFVTGSQGNGKVWTSDANGLGEWQTASGGLTSANFVVNETATGSTSATYSLAFTPTLMQQIFKNGVLLVPVTDYSVSGTTVTLVAARLTGDVFNNFYIK
jgi:lysophospholipase L1-like esterase